MVKIIQLTRYHGYVVVDTNVKQKIINRKYNKPPAGRKKD